MPHVVFNEKSKTNNRFEIERWQQKCWCSSNVQLMGSSAVFICIYITYKWYIMQILFLSMYMYCLFFMSIQNLYICYSCYR